MSEPTVAAAYAYAYDTAGRLASVSLGGVVQASYTYDWKGQQAVRRFPASGAAIQSVFDFAGHRIAEYDEGTGGADPGLCMAGRDAGRARGLLPNPVPAERPPGTAPLRPLLTQPCRPPAPATGRGRRG